MDDPTSIRSASFGLSPNVVTVIIRGYAYGFRAVFLMTVGATALSFLVSVFVIQQLSLKREDDAELKAASKQRLRMLKKGGISDEGEKKARSPTEEKLTLDLTTLERDAEKASS
jgi:hypothetical protein